MVYRHEVYVCERCESAVGVVRGGEGALHCCGKPMQLLEQSPHLEVPSPEDLTAPPHMEYNLDMSIKEAMVHMQRRIANSTTYFGVSALKCPLDFWVYCEIIHEVRPDVVIEVGNGFGGGALALAHYLDNLGHGRVIGIDFHHEYCPEVVRNHPRITFVDGHACEDFAKVRTLLEPDEKVLVIEDSEHSYRNTLDVLRLYAPLVPVGGYVIVEDSNCHHGIDHGPNPGPYEAVESFVQEHPEFEVDRARESFVITWNPKGYLKRVR